MELTGSFAELQDGKLVWTRKTLYCRNLSPKVSKKTGREIERLENEINEIWPDVLLAQGKLKVQNLEQALSAELQT